MAIDKTALRNLLKERRSQLDPELRRIMDTRIRDGVLKSEEWAAARVVLTYLSIGDEVGTRMLIKAALEAGKMVALPRVVGPQQMTWYLVESMEEITTPGVLEKSSFGIEEPRADESRQVPAAVISGTRPSETVVALVPGLAFDARGYRIGYGGGYFDTFLREFTGVSLGLCRRAFYLSELPGIEAHDMPVTRVVVG